MDSNDFNKYGVPAQKKFPMPDADHVRSAIKFFNYVSPQYEKILARAILRRAKEYGVDLSEMSIGDENRFKKYLPESELKHFGILGMKWGVRRFQNKDGTLTQEGKSRYRKYLEKEKEYNDRAKEVSNKIKDLKKNGIKSETFKNAKYEDGYAYDYDENIEVFQTTPGNVWSDKDLLEAYLGELETYHYDYIEMAKSERAKGEKFIDSIVSNMTLDELDSSLNVSQRIWLSNQLRKKKNNGRVVDLATGKIFEDENGKAKEYKMKKK